MTLSSLRTLLRVRLYTAISLTVDIADFTEKSTTDRYPIRPLSNPIDRSRAAQTIPLNRQKEAGGIAYQSAIALKYAALAQLQPAELAVQTVQNFKALLPALEAVSIESNATGWITLRLPYTEVARFLNQDLVDIGGPPDWGRWPEPVLNPPFLIGYTAQRCYRLRTMLLQEMAAREDTHSYQLSRRTEKTDVHARDAGGALCAGQAADDRRQASNVLLFEQPLPEMQDLMEALLDWQEQEERQALLEGTDRRDWLEAGHANWPKLQRLCQCFDRLHRQIPLFSPRTPVIRQEQFLQCAVWTQVAIQQSFGERCL